VDADQFRSFIALLCAGATAASSYALSKIPDGVIGNGMASAGTFLTTGAGQYLLMGVALLIPVLILRHFHQLMTPPKASSVQES
jgi:hypothetical protein